MQVLERGRLGKRVVVSTVMALVAALPLTWALAGGRSGTAAAMARAAEAFLGSLNEEQRAQAQAPFEADERTQWHFIPKDRSGLMVKNMSPPQRKLAHALLKTGVSAAGYKKTTAIMSLERVLAEMEDDPVRRDPDKYHVSIFGSPAADGTWGWKFEGHHVSLNFTVVKGNLLASTPAFLGANPGEVRQGPLKGTRVLGREEDEGRRFLKSLNEAQRRRAIFDQTAPPDVVTGAASRAEPPAPVGITAPELTPAQVGALDRLVKMYASTMAPELANVRLARVKAAGVQNLAFGWAGGTERGEPHYYRITGPNFIVEYDNTQNGANHVHTVWRDYENDFGRDLLRKHLSTDHQQGN